MTPAPGTSPAPRRSPAPRLGPALAGLALCLAAGTPLALLSGPAAATYALLAGTAAAYLAAASAVRAALAAHGRARAGMLLLALGCLGWAAGNTFWSWRELVTGGGRLFPSPADAGFLLFPVAGAAGLWLLAGRAGAGSRLTALLDGLVFTGSLLAISWLVVLEMTYRSGPDTPLAFAVSMAYPCGDVLLATMLYPLATRVRPGSRTVIALLVLGLGAMLVADTVFAVGQPEGDYLSGQLSDAGWVVGFGALAVAARQLSASPLRTAEPADPVDPVDPVDPGEPRRWQVLLPYLPFGALMATGAAELARGERLGRFPTGIVEALFLLVIVRQMITLMDNRALTDRIRHQAFHDTLTGLANRALFTDRLQHALALRERGEHELVVLCIDLNDFALVNDTLGHEAGDLLLQGVAERLRGCFRPADTIARIGGDEFGVIVEGTMPPAGEAERVLDALRHPFGVRVGSVTPSVSVGVAATTPLTAGTTLAPGELMKQVDLALAAAKAQGPDDYAVFEPVMSDNFDEEMALRRELARALDRGDLTVVHQPIHDLAGGQIVGVEALARWSDGTLGDVPPATFIPVAERAHLIAPIGEFVFDRACQEFGRWNAGGDRYLSVNVSPLQLLEPAFAETATRTAARHGLDPTQIVLEVTETALAEESEIAPVLRSLRARGFRVAIDDFGTGYASLRYLQHFPADVIKIDRSYVADVETDPEAAKLLSALLQMVFTLGLSCVAEGIETAGQAARLVGLGCPQGQGFLFSRPAPLAEIPLDAPWGDAAAPARERVTGPRP